MMFPRVPCNVSLTYHLGNKLLNVSTYPLQCAHLPLGVRVPLVGNHCLKVAQFLRNLMENVNHIESMITIFWNNHPVCLNWTGCWPKCRKVMILLLFFFYVLSSVTSGFSFGDQNFILFFHRFFPFMTRYV